MPNESRPRLKEDEQDVIKKYRAFKKSAEKKGLDPSSVKHGWFKSNTDSLFAKNPGFKTEEEQYLNNIRAEIISITKQESTKVKKRKVSGNHLLVVDPADIHIGKLCEAIETGDEYNTNIAVKRCKEGVLGLIEKAKGFPIEQILFIGGNDVLHIDTPDRKTTSGTPQDTDKMWYSNFLQAVKLYKELLTILSNVAPVHFIYNPSNHDYTNGFFLCQLIEAYFAKDKNITFDVSINHRKYYSFHNTLLGFTHGDGAKTTDLPSIMAQEVPKLWANSNHRYFCTHHVHHKFVKDLIGCTIEAFRSPSGTDSWHHKKGYVGVPKAVEALVIDRDFGQVARLTHLFNA